MINKVDLVKQDEIENIEKRIKELNDYVTCHRTCKSHIQLDVILNIGAYDESRAINVDKELENLIAMKKQGQSESNTCTEDHNHSSSCSNNRSSHLSDVTTICLVADKPLDDKKITQWLGKLLWDDNSDMEILRMKGVLSIGNESNRFALQGVHDIFDLSRTNIPWGDSERISKVVVIGKKLNEKELESNFNSCLF